MDENKAKFDAINAAKATEPVASPAEEKVAENSDAQVKHLEAMRRDMQASTNKSTDLMTQFIESKTQVQVVNAPPSVAIDMGKIREAEFDAAYEHRSEARRRWGV